MSLQPFPGFDAFPTHHCVTGSLRHIYAYYGQPFSEELLLGLGSGIGFVYWHMKGTDPFMGGRANVGRSSEEGLEMTVGRRTGVRVQIHQTSSAAKAQVELIDELAAGVPVMMAVDMGFLPYFDFPEEYHFGGHVVVAAGYDPHIGQVLLADRDLPLHPVSLQDLAKARGSQFKPFPPRNTRYSFDFSQSHPPAKDEIVQSICEVTRGMLHPPIHNLGVDGIRKAAQRIRDWPNTMSMDELRRTCFNAYIFIDEIGGSGGGLFRFMYGRFLHEAATLTELPALAQVGDDLLSIGERWQAVAELFHQSAVEPEPNKGLLAAAGLLPKIADSEQAAWKQLEESIG